MTFVSKWFILVPYQESNVWFWTLCLRLTKCKYFILFLLLAFLLEKNFKDFIYLFLKRGEGGEKERERNISVWLPLAHPLLGTWPATQACALTGNRTCDPLVHSPRLNLLSHTSQGEFFIYADTFQISVFFLNILWHRFHVLCFQCFYLITF